MADSIEIEITGNRVIVPPRFGHDKLCIQVVGSRRQSDVAIDALAAQIVELLGGTWERADHPGAGHIRICTVESSDSLEQIIAKLEQCK